MQLFFQRYGDGPPLIILHGLLGASGNWHTLASKEFARHFEVFAVDLRNHGRSPHSDTFDYPAMVDDVLEFIERHGLEEPDLLGHSLGGKVAMQLALAHPAHVGRLVVVDMAPRAYPPQHQPIFEALQALNLDELDSRAEIDEALAGQITSAPIRQFLLKNLDYDREAGRYFWKMNLAALARNYDAVNEPILPGRTFSKPALFIRGGRSDYVQEDDWPAIRTLFPQAELVTIEKAGHWVHAEQPQALADTVLTFLAPNQPE